LRPLGYKTLIEILARGRGARIRECPYGMRPRERGRSKLALLQSIQYLAQLVRLRAAARADR
jgi:dolichol-phosphate mannosyltransferase